MAGHDKSPARRLGSSSPDDKAAAAVAAAAAPTSDPSSSPNQAPSREPSDGDVDSDDGRLPVGAASITSSDTDSALGMSEDSNSTSSLRSSVFEMEEENGRLYHSYSRGKYILPSDEGESERLDVQHEHFIQTFYNRICFAPGAATAKRVLDAGTGTGIWAIDFAEEHPDADVCGVDIAPIQPPYVPPNCRFELDDLEQEWTWTEPFDYIFSRMMNASFADWNAYTRNCWNHLSPNGWIEMIDSLFPLVSDDGSLKPEHALYEWSELLVQASEKFGRSLKDAEGHKRRLRDHGFINVVEEKFKWPTNGKWPDSMYLKRIGEWTHFNIDRSLEGLSMALLTRGHGWTQEEVLAYLPAVRKDMRDPKIKAYWPLVVVYGQKPDLPADQG